MYGPLGGIYEPLGVYTGHTGWGNVLATEGNMGPSWVIYGPLVGDIWATRG